MLKILIIGDMPIRIRDQILLCEQLLTVNPNYKFTFLIVNRKLVPLFLNISKRITHIVIGENSSDQLLKNKKIKEQKHSHKLQESDELYKRLPFFIYELISFVLIMFDLYKNYFRIQKLIDTIKPNLIISNKDSNLGIEPIVLKIAKEKKISVIIPYFVYSDDIGIAALYNRRYNKKKAHSFLTKLIMRSFPGQVKIYKNRKFLFYSPSFTVAYKLFGVLSKNPWINGNGLSNIVCVDTKKTYQRYLDYKISKNKLMTIGDVMFDRLFAGFNKKKQIKEQILHKYQLDKKRKNIIVSLPQLAELGLINQKTHFKEINFLLKSLQNENSNILVSLHPRMDPLDYQFLEKVYDCRIVNERLFDVIFIADLFISTYSSTVIWSVLSKVPTIIIDFSQLNYTMYNFLQTVTVVNKKTEFKKILEKKLTDNLNYSKDWIELSRNFIFDGQTIKRYNDIFLKFKKIYKRS